MSKDAFDYIELYILILSILCVAIAAPIFQMNIKRELTVFYEQQKRAYSVSGCKNFGFKYDFHFNLCPWSSGTFTDIEYGFWNRLFENLVSNAVLYHKSIQH